MPQYRMVIFFGQADTGWSETYYTPDLAGIAIADAVSNMVVGRASFLFPNDYVSGVRLSVVVTTTPGRVRATRVSRLLRPGPNQWPDPGIVTSIPAAGLLPPADSAQRPDQVRAALRCSVGFDGGRSTIRYLAGIPDSVSAFESETYDPNGYVLWNQRFVQWRNALISGQWALKAQSHDAGFTAIPVIGLSGGALAGPWGVVVDSSGGVPPISQGDRVHLKGFTAAAGIAGTVNGVWTVESVTTAGVPARTTILFRLSSAINSLQVGHLGSITRVGEKLYPFQQWVGTAVGIHKRGRPSLAPRGRRLIRESLVP